MVTTEWYGFRGEFEADPLTYDPSKELRGKLCYLFESSVRSLAQRSNPYDARQRATSIWKNGEKRIKEAFGFPQLPASGPFSHPAQNFLYSAPQPDCIRAIEVLLNSFRADCYACLNKRAAENLVARVHKLSDGVKLVARVKELIDDVNKLFRMHACGYQVEMFDAEPKIRVIRTDSQFLYQETVSRPLALLRDVQFAAASSQFEDAIREWGEGNYADAITDANAAFESVMKTILGRTKGVAKDLIRDMAKRGYLPPYMASGASQLSDLMEMLPRLRDAESDSHGRVTVSKDGLPNYARLAINLSGSLISFLVEEWKRTRPIAPSESVSSDQ
jgi:hypothetical protein